MGTETFQLIYDGKALSSHQMDVYDLVPALKGLGDLIRDANQQINQDRAKVNVLINSQIERGSFCISVDVYQHAIEAIQTTLALVSVKDIKDILELLDLLGVAPKGIFEFFKWRNGQEIEVAQQIKDITGSGNLQINIKGDNNKIFMMPPEAYKLATQPSLARAAKSLLQPLKSPGIDTLITKKAKKQQLRIKKEDVESIEASCDIVLKSDSVISQSVVTAHLKPYDAEFNVEAKTWGFWYGDRHINADITLTEIAKLAIERRQVSMDDFYKVDLEITETKLPSGQIKVTYKILKVHGQPPGARQLDLLDA